MDRLNCPLCDTVVALQESDFKEKIDSHMLWHHPTEKQIAQLLVELHLHTQASIAKIDKEEYIEASFVLTDLADRVLRLKKYVDLKLENE